MREALNTAFDDEISADPRDFLMGEEVGAMVFFFLGRSMDLRGLLILQSQRLLSLELKSAPLSMVSGLSWIL